MFSGPSSNPPYCGFDIPTESLGYLVNCDCNATIPGDSDIAGSGVMVAYLVTGWLTFILAGVAGWYRFWEDVDKFKKRRAKAKTKSDGNQSNSIETSHYLESVTHPYPPSTSISPILLTRNDGQKRMTFRELTQKLANDTIHGPPKTEENEEERVEKYEPRLKLAVEQLLAPLCDLQVATGTAILIAGLAQGHELTYYHEALISSYWNVTLNSFWAAQLSNNKYDYVGDLPSFVRTSAVLCTLVLSIYFQSRQIIHDYKDGYWDALDGTHCFLLNHDHSDEKQAWLWIVGLSLYAFILAMNLSMPLITRILRITTNRRLGKTTESVERNEPTESRNRTSLTDRISFDFVDDQVEKLSQHLKQKGSKYRWLRWLVVWALRIFFFLLINFLAVWSLGTGSFGIEVLALLGYLTWNTLDVIDAKVSNLTLVDPPETSWGFGQVLPVMLVGVIIFNGLDAYKDDKERKAERNKNLRPTD